MNANTVAHIKASKLARLTIKDIFNQDANDIDEFLDKDKDFLLIKLTKFWVVK